MTLLYILSNKIGFSEKYSSLILFNASGFSTCSKNTVSIDSGIVLYR